LGVSLKQESKPVDTSREGGASMEVKKPKIEFNRSGLSFEEFAQEYFRIQAEDYWAKFKLCVTLDNGYSVIVNSAQVVLEGGPSNKPRPPESIIGEVEDTRRNRKLFKDFSVVKEGTISVTIPGKKIDEIKIERVRRQQSL
jgi:hypothetical protein